MKNRLLLKKDKETGAGQLRNSHDDVTIADLTRIVRANLKLIAVVTTVAMIITAVFMFATPNRFTSRASLLPSGQTDRMASLKMLAGISSNKSDENSSELFPIILRSNSVRDSVLESEYFISIEGKQSQVSLSEYLGSDNRDLLRERLSSITTIDTDANSGLIEISVETIHPELSQAVTANYLVQLDQYNINGRQTEAGRRATYLERELSQKRHELNTAEDSLSIFQSYNRNWRTSSDPGLLTQLAALKRDVEIKAEVFAFLSREFESARLDIQKDTPVIRVLDHPSLPTIKSGPRRILTILMSGMAAFMILAMLSIGRSLLPRVAVANFDERPDHPLAATGRSKSESRIGKMMETSAN